MNKLKSLSYSTDKNILILKITCLFWLIAKLMGRRMWTTQRLLPTVPAFEFLDYVPSIVHTILFVLSVSFLILIFLKKNKYFMIGLLGAEFLSYLLDQNRLVPWEYLYAFIIFIFIINQDTPALIAPSVILLLVSTYFYSGLCKLNEGFLHIVWSNMMLHAFFKVPSEIINQNWVHYSGYLLGVTELLAGLGLLFKKTKVSSSVILIVIHLLILLLLGPLGLSGYRVLWPWNISMILFLYVIFLYKRSNAITFRPATEGWNKLVFVCWVILPALSFFGYWDRNLSSNLFSANLPRMIICVNDTSKCKPLQRFLSKRDIPNTCQGKAKIDIQTWAIAETGVSAYPEIRTYRIIQKKLEQQYTAAGLSFVYLDR
jgi:hypothetical protein